jgi:hypothetical protein
MSADQPNDPARQPKALVDEWFSKRIPQFA